MTEGERWAGAVGLDVYPRLVRVWLAVALGVAVAASVSRPGLVAYASVGWLAFRQLGVPQRRALVEGWLVVAVAVGLAHGARAGIAVAAAGLLVGDGLLRRVRPEVAVQPLVGFDLCHLLLMSPVRASTTHHFLELRAPLDRARLTAALAALIVDVDRLRSFVREAPLGVERFVAARVWVEPSSLVAWHDAPTDPAVVGWFERAIDVARSPPVRLFHAPRAGGGFIFGFTLHHSVADATGAMVLLDGLLRRYDRASGHDVPLPPILTTGPRCRRLAWRRGPRSVGAMLLRAARHTTRGVRSASLLDDETPRPARFARQHVDVPAATWRDVLSAASHSGCTPNHFLMAASLLAADEVRRTRRLADETFRVIVPSDLRTLFSLPRSLPNYIGTVPLEVSADEVRRDGLPQRVRDRVGAGRTAEAQMCFPIQLGLLGLLPPALGRRILRKFDEDPRTFAFSFLFSHIRVPRELHRLRDHEVERLWCASSQGRQPAFGVAITTIGERTWALLQYLTPYVAAEAAQQFARELLLQLRRLTDETQVTGQPTGHGTGHVEGAAE